MYIDNYVKIYFSDLDNDLFLGEPFSKLHAWADLLFISNVESNVLVRGRKVCVNNGEVQMSLRDLCKRWGWGNSRMNSFMAMLEQEGRIIIRKSKVSTYINVCNYDIYLSTKSPCKSQNESPTKSPKPLAYGADNVDVTSKKTENFELTKSPCKSPCKSPTKSQEKTQSTAKSPTKSPKPLAYGADNVDVTSKKTTQKKENESPTKSPKAKNIDIKEKGKDERKENKKENFPHTPLKEINKEKKEEKGKESPASPIVEAETPNVVSCLPRACVGVRESDENLILTPEEPTKESQGKKSQEKKEPKDYALTYRAREEFSKFYRDRYGEEKYWKVSEMTALKQLLKQIRFSREHRDNPLPIDDDSLLSAFVEFINSICTPWILQNFLVTNLNSKYDTIIQDIKNNRNGNIKSTNNAYQATQRDGQSIIARQKQNCIDELKELERKLAAGEIKGRRFKGNESLGELPDF